MDSSDEELFLFNIMLEEEDNNSRRKHKVWVHDICNKRRLCGEFHHLFLDLKNDPTKFFEYFRMSHENFEEIHEILQEDLNKQTTSFRRPIESRERLTVCLRFLATGNSFRSMALSFRLGEKTVRSIVYETCTAIWNKMKITTPADSDWKEIAEEFWENWNFPNCIGALDGEHVVIECPAHSGSNYFCYKKTFSIVLLALVGPDYKFLIVDIGGLGKNSDGNIFANSELGKALRLNKLNLPSDSSLPDTEEPMPYVFVGDAAFPLGRHLMRPYPGIQTANDEEKKIFNYRLSRARRVSENAFGLLCKRFRIYERRLSMTPEHVNVVVAATCCLHNFLIRTTSDSILQNSNAEVMTNRLESLSQMGGNASRIALDIRDKFKRFFVSNTGSLSWQRHVVRRGFHNTE